MIKKFKLFLESIDTEDNIIEISVDEYDAQFELDSICMDPGFLHELNIALGRTSSDSILKISSSEISAFNYSHNDELMSVFIDNDYWLYVNYDIMPVSASGAPNENYSSLYHKIDISEGLIHIEKYLKIVDQKRNIE